MFPKLAKHLSAAWDQLPQWTYRSHAEGRPFRFRQSATFLNDRRDNWFARVGFSLQGLDPDPVWLAAWTPFLSDYGLGEREVNLILTSAIDAGGDTARGVVEVLKLSATNSHDIGIMGTHVTDTMMMSSSPECWEFVEKMLLAAQRQEGLRQSILESAYLAHPTAFHRLLKLIVEHDLVRFSSVVRAIDLWFGFHWDSMSSGKAQETIKTALELIDDPTAAEKAITGKDGERAYLGLWTQGLRDASAASAKAEQMLTSRSAPIRMAGVCALKAFRMPHGTSGLCNALRDEELSICGEALGSLFGVHMNEHDITGVLSEESYDDHPVKFPRPAALFDNLKHLFGRIEGKSSTFKPVLFPWCCSEVGADAVGRALVDHCPPARCDELIPYLPRFDAYRRAEAARHIGRLFVPSWRDDETKNPRRLLEPLTKERRKVLIELLGDPASDVRAAAQEVLAFEPMTAEELDKHEELLSRAASDIRLRAIAAILKQSDVGALASAQRLLDKGGKHALIGAEILRSLVEAKRSVTEGQTAAHKVIQQGKKLKKELLTTLETVLERQPVGDTRRETAFGLAQPVPPKALPQLQKRTPLRETRAAVALIWSLDEFIERNKTVDVLPSKDSDRNPEHHILGSLSYTWSLRPSIDKDDEKRDLSVLRGLVSEWRATTIDDLKDADGLHVLRAWLIVEGVYEPYRGPVRWPKAIQELAPPHCKGDPKYFRAIELLLLWLMEDEPESHAEILLDQTENAVLEGRTIDPDTRDADDERESEVPFAEMCGNDWLRMRSNLPKRKGAIAQIGWIRREYAISQAALAGIEKHVSARLEHKLTTEDGARQWKQNVRDWVELFEPCFSDFLRIWEAGDISDDELLIRLCAIDEHYGGEFASADELAAVLSLRTAKRSHWLGRQVEPSARLDVLVESLRKRILEIEFSRGNSPTSATPHAMSMKPSGGIDAVIPALAGLKDSGLMRKYIYRDNSKQASFSTIIRNARVGPSDTPEAFAKSAKEAGLSEQRLVELALYEPRWAAHVEHAVGWKGLEEAVLWLRAHTRAIKMEYFEPQEIEPWEARVAELTPIPLQSLAHGAVDRAWFKRMRQQLGDKRWEVLYDACKYASSGAGHTRARLFADAIEGNVSEKELNQRINGKRHQDAARALGLLDIAAGPKGKKQVLDRYKTLQEMRRTSRKHGGSMLQASEKLAVEIGLENLAWTAGYPDPLRLQWAMEIEELGELAKGPMVVKVGTCEVKLEVDEEGEPTLTAVKDGKALKAIPPAVKSDKKVVPLVEKHTAIRKQRPRVRQALEQAMCRGDALSGAELPTLFQHPLLKHMLARLVLVRQGEGVKPELGYPDKGGKSLRGLKDVQSTIRAADQFRIAHPLDLLASKHWSEWQRECFSQERVQPFKQIFRELYVPTEAELKREPKFLEESVNRYEGQQVQPRQALALFGSRGWVAKPEEGVQRTYHKERITVHLTFMETFYTPADIEGLTLEGLLFRHSNSFKTLAVKDVPPRIYSEVMRDLDLVVSVAHRGDVDPEASQGTVEMRTSLTRETCGMLGLTNVTFAGNRANITGHFGDYNVHLGSGTIHRMPGGTVWVIPVHSQHRGRVFLPFADDDPKTAEIISKVLLLARDREIQDPSILSQIRG